LAQSNIVADDTLGADSSVVIQNFNGAPTEVIAGGAERGQNLFHSFQEFNVEANRNAFFFSPNADIQNILARVTGGNPSEILGVLGTFGNSEPNLFLMNPRGIVFGPNARLAVGGSFVASTADSLVFENGFEFGATNPEAPPLLTINVPIGLQYGANPGRIVNQSRAVDINGNVGLRVQPERTLALVGGDVDIEGGVLFAPNGRVELGSVAGNSLVNLLPTDAGYTLDYEGVEGFQDIRLSQAAAVGSSGGDNSSIQVQGRNVVLTEGSQIVAFTQGQEAGGNLNVNASESVELIGGGGIGAQTFGSGEGGNISLSARQLLVQDGARVSASTFGEGNGGSLIVEVEELVQLVGTDANGFPSGVFATTQGSGEGGNLSLSARQLLVQDGAQVSASTFSEGNGGSLIVEVEELVQLVGTDAIDGSPSGVFAVTLGSGEGGNLSLSAGQLLVQDGAVVSASTVSEGNGGTLIVEVEELVQLVGTDANGSPSGVFAQTQGSGEGGNLSLSAGQLLVQDGAQVSASTNSEGNGGTLSVEVEELVQLVGTDAIDGSPSAISVTTSGSGEGGNLSLSARQLLVQDGAQVSASTGGEGNGGTLSVEVEELVQLVGTDANGSPSGVFAETLGSGEGGNLSLSAGQLLVQDGAVVSASTVSEGNGGSLIVEVEELVQLVGTAANGSPSGVFAVTLGSGEGGNLSLSAGQLLVQDGAQVSASTFSEGNGGTLIVEVEDSVQLIGIAPNGAASRIGVETTGTGKGGNLTLTARQLLVQDGAVVSASTFSEGNGGSLIVEVEELVQLVGTDAIDGSPSGVFATTSGSGEGGNLSLSARQLLVQDGAVVSASTFSEGNGGTLSVEVEELVQLVGTAANGSPSGVFASTQGSGEGGNLRLSAGQLLVQDGANVSANTFSEGNGGTLSVEVEELVQLVGTAANGSPSGIAAETQGSGEGGNLRLSARQLLVQDGANVSASTTSEGNGGSLIVEVEELVQLVGINANGSPSGVFATTSGSGEGGNLRLSARQLLVQDGANVSASTFSEGNGGTLMLDVSESVLLDEEASIEVLSEASGNGGDLILTTDQLTVQNGSLISVSSPASRAGNLTITADTLSLNDGEVSAETGVTGAEEGANIILQDLDLLLLENESLISATALEDANGGNVTINADFIVAKSPTGPEGSDITANAVRGNGGRVSVTSNGLFGIEFRPQRTPLNDITVSSQFGLAGDFIDNTPGIDPSQGLATLPSNLVDPESLIDRSCTPGSAALQSSFIITGRGGIPTSPTDPLSSNDIVSEWVTLDSEEENSDDTETDTNPTSTAPQPIVEAQGWTVNERGQVVLVANAPTVTPQAPRQTAPPCEDIRANAPE
jgi:filamentous hemagglutinin family protein